ncbi:MAG: HAMP domain-containing histidine kinase [Deltaproteobacteria bacterium]|nr:HAMP domain-containing histidine kinase [Deltaproteobacteria bacterium]
MSTQDPSPLSGGELAHAPRNPLSSVKIALQSLRREAPGPRTHLALREVRRMERLLSALAEWGRDVAHDDGASPLPELLGGAADEVREELQLRGARMAFSVPSEPLPPVRCAPLRTRPLLAQLLLECADRAGPHLQPAQLTAWEGGVELVLEASGLSSAGGARACLAAQGALLVPTGGRARARGPDAVSSRFAP